MRLDGVALLAAPTTRSQAYLQALVANALCPEHVIRLGEATSPANIHGAAGNTWKGVALPDLTESLATTCARAGIEVTACDANDVNAEVVARAIRHLGPRIVIYSGYGGQIVEDHILGLGPPFLHLHSGWLPEYRGSTTLYYALLNREDPGVTALVLDRTIDTGPIVAQCHYPKPSPTMDIDRVYDAAIRADLLVRVMQTYVRTGSLSLPAHRNAPQGATYYVIHPVLKHVAILSLEKGAAS